MTLTEAYDLARRILQDVLDNRPWTTEDGSSIVCISSVDYADLSGEHHWVELPMFNVSFFSWHDYASWTAYGEGVNR